MAKAKKKRAEHYDKPLKIEGSFNDVIKVAMQQPEINNVELVRQAISRRLEFDGGTHTTVHIIEAELNDMGKTLSFEDTRKAVNELISLNELQYESQPSDSLKILPAFQRKKAKG
jgi:hypothetical protein